MFKGKFYTSKDNCIDPISVRKSIPEFATGADECDNMAFYAVIYDESDTPLASGRLFIDDDSAFRIDYLGVLPEYRGKYIGDLLARMLLFKAQDFHAGRLNVTTPKEYVRFFARYGLKASDTTGDFVDMSVNGDAIILEGSCSKGKRAACGGNCAECGK